MLRSRKKSLIQKAIPPFQFTQKKWIFPIFERGKNDFFEFLKYSLTKKPSPGNSFKGLYIMVRCTLLLLPSLSLSSTRRPAFVAPSPLAERRKSLREERPIFHPNRPQSRFPKKKKRDLSDIFATKYNHVKVMKHKRDPCGRQHTKTHAVLYLHIVLYTTVQYTVV